MLSAAPATARNRDSPRLPAPSNLRHEPSGFALKQSIGTRPARRHRIRTSLSASCTATAGNLRDPAERYDNQTA